MYYRPNHPPQVHLQGLSKMIPTVPKMAINHNSRELWRHPDPGSTPLFAFLNHVKHKFRLDIDDYPGLYKWSTQNPSEFWGEAWHFCGIRASQPYSQV